MRTVNSCALHWLPPQFSPAYTAVYRWMPLSLLESHCGGFWTGWSIPTVASVHVVLVDLAAASLAHRLHVSLIVGFETSHCPRYISWWSGSHAHVWACLTVMPVHCMMFTSQMMLDTSWLKVMHFHPFIYLWKCIVYVTGLKYVRRENK